MGLYVGVCSKDGKPVSDLGQDKYSGGREFVGIMASFDTVQRSNDPEMLRPSDASFAPLLQACARMGANRVLFRQMVEDVRDNPDHWFDISY